MGTSMLMSTTPFLMIINDSLLCISKWLKPVSLKIWYIALPLSRGCSNIQFCHLELTGTLMWSSVNTFYNNWQNKQQMESLLKTTSTTFLPSPSYDHTNIQCFVLEQFNYHTTNRSPQTAHTSKVLKNNKYDKVGWLVGWSLTSLKGSAQIQLYQRRDKYDKHTVAWWQEGHQETSKVIYEHP